MALRAKASKHEYSKNMFKFAAEDPQKQFYSAPTFNEDNQTKQLKS
jgi:hypothetical protein